MADYDVLIIEDDESVRTSCIQSLEIEEITASGAGSVEDALKMLPPDFTGVIVTDLRLPGLSGMDLLHQMQTVAPGIPVIMITGHGDILTAVEAMRSGAYDFLPKPFSPQVLIQQVKRALEKRKLTLKSKNCARSWHTSVTWTAALSVMPSPCASCVKPCGISRLPPPMC